MERGDDDATYVEAVQVWDDQSSAFSAINKACTIRGILDVCVYEMSENCRDLLFA